jgi:hypothetical protein
MLELKNDRWNPLENIKHYQSLHRFYSLFNVIRFPISIEENGAIHLLFNFTDGVIFTIDILSIQ